MKSEVREWQSEKCENNQKEKAKKFISEHKKQNGIVVKDESYLIYLLTKYFKPAKNQKERKELLIPPPPKNHCQSFLNNTESPLIQKIIEESKNLKIKTIWEINRDFLISCGIWETWNTDDEICCLIDILHDKYNWKITSIINIIKDVASDNVAELLMNPKLKNLVYEKILYDTLSEEKKKVYSLLIFDDYKSKKAILDFLVWYGENTQKDDKLDKLLVVLKKSSLPAPENPNEYRENSPRIIDILFLSASFNKEEKCEYFVYSSLMPQVFEDEKEVSRLLWKK